MTKGRCIHCSRQGLEIKCAVGLDPVAMAKASCKTGEDYQVGLFLRIPCDSKEWDLAHYSKGSPPTKSQLACIEQKASCDKFTDPTDEQIKSADLEMKKAMDDFRLTLPLIERIKKQHRGTNWRGVEECPVCKGKLHMSHAQYNGHVHGQCETKDCLSWLE